MGRPADLVAWWLAHVDHHCYSAASDRFGPRCMDCSGSVFDTLVYGGGLASWTVPTVSATQAQWLYRSGNLHPDSPYGNPPLGWLRFHGPSMGMGGYGDNGHVAIADGAGGVYECKGRAWGCLHDSAAGRPWTGCGPVPGITYGPSPSPGGFLPMLNDAQQAELLQNTRILLAQMGDLSKPGSLQTLDQRAQLVQAALYNLAKPGSLATMWAKLLEIDMRVMAIQQGLGQHP